MLHSVRPGVRVGVMPRQRRTVQPAGKVYDLSAADAAAMLGVSPETMKRYARMEKVDARKTFSGRWVFNTDDILSIQVFKVVA